MTITTVGQAVEGAELTPVEVMMVGEKQAKGAMAKFLMTDPLTTDIQRRLSLKEKIQIFRHERRKAKAPQDLWEQLDFCRNDADREDLLLEIKKLENAKIRAANDIVIGKISEIWIMHRYGKFPGLTEWPLRIVLAIFIGIRVAQILVTIYLLFSSRWWVTFDGQLWSPYCKPTRELFCRNAFLPLIYLEIVDWQLIAAASCIIAYAIILFGTTGSITFFLLKQDYAFDRINKASHAQFLETVLLLASLLLFVDWTGRTVQEVGAYGMAVYGQMVCAVVSCLVYFYTGICSAVSARFAASLSLEQARILRSDDKKKYYLAEWQQQIEQYDLDQKRKIQQFLSEYQDKAKKLVPQFVKYMYDTRKDCKQCDSVISEAFPAGESEISQSVDSKGLPPLAIGRPEEFRARNRKKASNSSSSFEISTPNFWTTTEETSS